MANILVIDDTPFWRDITGEGLRRNGHTVFTAGNGLEALQSLRTQNIDLLILDVEMPQMPGLSFLQQLRQREEWKSLPVIMLTGDMQRDHIIHAKKLGAVDYLLKARFSLPELLSRVDRGLDTLPAQPVQSAQSRPQPRTQPSPQPIASRTTEMPRLLDREQCIARAQAVLSGRNLSPAVARVISLTSSPRSDLSELASFIGHDPVLSIRVIQASNRASRAAGRGVITTLPDAVRVLGCTTIRDIAVSVGVIDTMPPASGDGFNPIRSWQHSLAVARLCGQLAPAESSGTAYLIGLCHDLGEILFHTHFQAEYNQVLHMQAITGKPLHELERAMLGLTHGQLAQTILRLMKLPDAIAHPIADFHEHTLTGEHLIEPLARVLQIADLYATGMLLAPSVHAKVRPLTRIECRAAIGADDPPQPDATPPARKKLCHDRALSPSFTP
jgi:CheY-like chemotaxis protein/HD-like signal output (HDOD) protein